MARNWDLARAETKDGGVVLTPSNVDLFVKGGFKTGWIYEFIYDTEGSRHVEKIYGTGELAYCTRREERHLAVSGGFVEVRNDKVIVLADTAERPIDWDTRAVANPPGLMAVPSEYCSRCT